MKKRLVSLLVALCMAVTLLPVSAITAWAEESGSNLKSLQFQYGYPVTDGIPFTTDFEGHTIYTGDGWSYDGTDKVLTLAPENPTTYNLSAACLTQNSIACSIIIERNVTITDGNFYDCRDSNVRITNYGAITGGSYTTSITNHGTITGGIFHSPITNELNGTIENGTFRATVTNTGTINGGIFSAIPTGGTIVPGYILNAVAPNDNVRISINDIDISCYVIPNQTHPTKITVSYRGTSSPLQPFPIDVTFNSTQILLEDWAQNVTYTDSLRGFFITFTAPITAATSVTLSKLTRLVIDKDGYPVGTKGGTQNYSGNGWKFEKDNKTLTLESGNYTFEDFPSIKCPVDIKNGVTVTGGEYNRPVINRGTLENAIITGTFDNYGTVKNSYFIYPSYKVTNHNGTMPGCLFAGMPEGIEFHTITEVEDYYISAALADISLEVMQNEFYFTGTPKLRVSLIKNGNAKPVTSINQKLNYGGLTKDSTSYPVSYIFTVENGNEDVVLNAAPVPGKDDPKPVDPEPEPKPEPDPTPEVSTYTLTVKGGTFTYNGGEAMTSASVPVDAEVKVTLNQSAVPEGMVFDLWAIDGADLLGNPAVAYNEESFIIPANSVAKGSTVTVEAQYRDATIESEPSILGTAAIIGVAGAGTAVLAWQGYRIGMELYEKYFQPTGESS